MLDSTLNIKKLTIRLRILLNDVIDYNWGSYFGVRSMDPDVLHLWEEYNNIWAEVISEYPQLKIELPELSYPEPYLADGQGFFSEGTMIYKPEHFSSLRLEVEKMLKTFTHYVKKESA
ncbi:MAG: hypothetical protein R2750_09565 [Bacteroidales bacterium]